MRFLMQEEVIPYLRRRFGLHGVIRSRTLKVSGLGESRVDERINDLELGSNPTVGLAAHPGQVDIRITAKADSDEAAAEMIRPMEGEIRRRLGDWIFGADEETLEGVVAALMAERKLRLNILETNTMGQVFGSLKGTPHGDATLGQGVLIATQEGLAEAFPQIAPLLEKEGFPSQVLASDLARRLNRPDSCDLSMAIVGDLAANIDAYSEHTGRTFMALVGPDFQEEASLPYGGISDLVKRRATTTALNLIRRRLLRIG
jgi:nicotinamide-nucleotide amidase